MRQGERRRTVDDKVVVVVVVYTQSPNNPISATKTTHEQKQ